MNVQTVDTAAEATAEPGIRTLLDGWLKAVRAQDMDGIMACYAPDVLAFDAIMALQFKGVDAYGKHWQACLGMCPGPMLFEIHDLGVEAAGDVAFGHYLMRCGHTDQDGQEKASWMRVTVGFRRKAGKWLIAHEHFSAPFDPASGKAIFDAQP